MTKLHPVPAAFRRYNRKGQAFFAAFLRVAKRNGEIHACRVVHAVKRRLNVAAVLIFRSSIAVPKDQKALLEHEIDYSYHILNFEFPEEHGHEDYWEFQILLEGNIYHFFNGKKIPCGKGSLYYLTTQDYHYLKKKDKDPIRYLNIVAKEKALLKLLDAISPTFKTQLLKGEHTFILPDSIILQVEELVHKAALLSPKQYVTQNNLVFSALMLILQFLYVKHIDSFEERQEWQEILNEAMLSQKFLTYRIDDLCETLNYSKSQLNRLFKKHYGMSPHDFLIKHKFRYACNLLTFTDMKVIDIAAKVGYKNLSQFNAIFKQRYGVTPSEYRKRY